MANGFCAGLGLPKDDGLIKNRYVARTFIQPGQELRKHGLRMKFNPLPEIVAGKRIVVVDDSIVRGNTTRQIVAMLKEAGAKEVHLRISAPPIRHPCHYGIDMSTREEMIACTIGSIEEIAKSRGPTRSRICRWMRSTRPSAHRGRNTATPASRVSTHWAIRPRRTASSRSRTSRSSRPR